MVVAEFMPLDETRQSSAPSSTLIFSSSVRVVGLPYRPYSYEPYRPSWYAISSSVSLQDSILAPQLFTIQLSRPFIYCTGMQVRLLGRVSLPLMQAGVISKLSKTV